MADLTAVIMRGSESKELDYKGPMKWDEKGAGRRACCELVKDILAMANTRGGWLVIGVEEADPPGPQFRWVGLSPEEASSFETSRLNQFVQRYADPPVNCEVIRYPCQDRDYVVITVPPFPETPHICQKAYHDPDDNKLVLQAPIIYVRTDDNASAPLKASSDLRAIIERAVRTKADQLLESFRAILVGSTSQATEPSHREQFRSQVATARARFDELNPHRNTGPAHFWDVWWHPSEFHPERFELQQLRAMAERASENFRGWPFIFISEARDDCTRYLQDCLETAIARDFFPNETRFDFWRLYQSGLLFVRKIVWEHAADQPDPKTMSARNFVHFTAEALRSLARVYGTDLAEDAPVHAVIGVTGTKDRRLVSPDPLYTALMGNAVAQSPEVIIERTCPLAEWRAGVVDHSVSLCRDVFLRFNWQEPDLRQIRTIIEKLFRRQG